MTINPSGLAFPPRHGRTVVGWVERQRNPSMASDEEMGIASLNPSYALRALHDPRRDDRGVAPGLGEQLRMQRDFERTRHLEQIDLRARDVARLDLIKEGDPAFLHHLAMPGRLHESDPLRFCKSRVRRNGRPTDRFGRFVYFGRVFYFGSVL